MKTLYGGEAKTTAPGEQLSFAAEDAADSTAASDSAAASSPEEADKKMETLTALHLVSEVYCQPWRGIIEIRGWIIWLQNKWNLSISQDFMQD